MRQRTVWIDKHIPNGKWHIHILIYGDGIESVHINSGGHDSYMLAQQEAGDILKQLKNVEYWNERSRQD